MSRRVRTLTHKAMANYQERVQKFEEILDKQWGSVQRVINDNQDLTCYDTLKLKHVKEEIIKQFNIYDANITDYQRYLQGVKTTESLQLLEDVVQLSINKRQTADNFLKRIRESKLQRAENSSTKSSQSGRSTSSIKLQTLKTKALYAEKTAELERKKAAIEEQEKIAAAVSQRQKSELEISLKLLQETQEAAIAEVELQASEDSEHSGFDELPTVNPAVKSALYVSKQPIVHMKPDGKSTETSQTVNDFTKFLLRKDILMSRLSTFNEQPETYQSWKSTFQAVVKEIGASPSEEIDLLIKWLGPVSKRQAISIKTAYIIDPVEGLRKIWFRLDDRYGSPENVYNAVVKLLEAFPKISLKNCSKLYDLSDILSQIEGLKEDSRYTTILSYFDSAVGVNPIISKLPHNLQEKWMTLAARYKIENSVPFPPFSVLAKFVQDQSRIRNDPSFNYDSSSKSGQEDARSTGNLKQQNGKSVSVHKTEHTEIKCPIHKANHSLENCRAFQNKSFEEKRKVLNEKKLCFRCFSDKHMARECKNKIECSVCSRKSHPTIMHRDSPVDSGRCSTTPSVAAYGESQGGEGTASQLVTSNCTEICDNTKSCAKIVLVNIYTVDNPNNVIKCYVVIDEQSNKSLMKSEMFSMLGIKGENYGFVLKTCSGSVNMSGRRAKHCVVESLDGSVRYALPTLIECDQIPDDKNEICTPDEARCHEHLVNVANYMPEFDENADIMLLLGRDIVEAHHVLDQVIGPVGAPFAQRLGLGWVVIGNLCLGQIHVQDTVNVHKTHVLNNGRTSLFRPCDQVSVTVQDPLFVKTHDDDKVSLSIEDREFLSIMNDHFKKRSDGSWEAPLPFRSPRDKLPNNKVQAVNRSRTLLKSFQKNPVKKQHFFEFMGQLLSNGHAELAPKLGPDEECWYLPIFGIYHPRKPNQVRVVFDSSAVFEGMSLNSVLIQGPDLTNSLFGILVRFRKDKIAILSDIEQMFYSFSVTESDRNFLRFLWFLDNDPTKPLVEYRMCKHVFGNSASPAIATYGLRKSVENSDEDIREFVEKDFYVDDGLSSQVSAERAVDLLKRTQSVLGDSKLRLHKIVSNNPEVMKCFPIEELAKGLKDLDLDSDKLPSQRSLGIVWNIVDDHFLFKPNVEVQPFTKRGILSTINSVFDPLGFVSPIVLKGRFILRDLMALKLDWDEPVPNNIGEKWQSWQENLKDLEKLQVPRCYLTESLSEMARVELHTFSDASEKAVSAVVYVVGFTQEGNKRVGFVAGKSKLAPEKGHTIPRLELCAAVLAVELFRSVSEHLQADLADVRFYTDSKVVLGYLNNSSRRFYTYVSNRVQKIVSVSNPNQWSYVSSDKNPADIGSRGATVAQLIDSLWLNGPKFLLQDVVLPEYFPLVDPQSDKEIRKEIVVSATKVVPQRSLSDRFERFSTWQSLVRAIATLRHIARSFHSRLPCEGWHICPKDLGLLQEASLYVLRTVQGDFYSSEIDDLANGRNLSRQSSIVSLDPVFDADGLLHVGGRLNRGELPDKEKRPIIVPGKHPVARLLVIHYHMSVYHQGRHFTEGALRTAGFWITGAKRLVSSVIQNCVICRRLRGSFASQKMSDLPLDRIQQASPFSYVGVDVFGPFQIVSRRTRGGQASSKRWGVLFTCLSIRAVHIEIIEDLSSSAFINALRRFTSIRGKVKVYRSDCGTNFVGAIHNIQAEAINVEDTTMQNYLQRSGSIWLFNSPHSSHMGGSWERMIGVARRILEAMLLPIKTLTHEVLTTLMAEVSAMINSRPIVPISHDPSTPQILSPSSLLTRKFENEELPSGNIDLKDLYRDQWKRVQCLANQFWSRWHKEYLQSLQKRVKWSQDQTPLKVGDVVLVKDLEIPRNNWPLARITHVFPSHDDRVRKVEVCVVKNGNKTLYTRPVVNLVLLVES